MDEQKLNEFVGKILGDLGGAYSIPLVRIGDRLGLYKALKTGPMTIEQLASSTKIGERYAREWLSHQAASGYLTYDANSQQFTLPPEQAAVLADEDSPVYLQGAFDLAVSMSDQQDAVGDAFRTGKGVPWSDQITCAFCAVARFFRPGYQNHLVQDWLPSLHGVVEKLERGAKIADVGCDHGVPTAIMASAFPKSTFIGYDFHPDSIRDAKAHAAQHGVKNVSFEVATSTEYPGNDYDLVTFFDCLHDMGDPTGAARHVRETLKSDGTWLIIEPMAGDTLTDNLNPVGRLYYAASTLICVPTSLAQPVGAALGAQAGFKKLSEVIGAGGFGNVRKATETPFNLILEATH